MASSSTTTESSYLKSKDQITEDEMELKQLLFDNVVKMPDWEKVVKIYKEDCRAHEMKITSSGDTALHLAIRASEKKIVQKLVELMMIKRVDASNKSAEQVLGIENEKGRTPLHLAASNGSKEMCRFIVEGAANDSKLLVLKRDKKGETPLFRAVHNDRKEAFLYLQSVVCEGSSNIDISHCYTNDHGRTILHNAIIRENFGKYY